MLATYLGGTKDQMDEEIESELLYYNKAVHDYCDDGAKSEDDGDVELSFRIRRGLKGYTALAANDLFA